MLLHALLLVIAPAHPTMEQAWADRAYQDTEADRLHHARSFVRDHAAAASPEQLIITHATIGSILWRQSCPNQDGCMSLQPPEPHSTTVPARTRTRRRLPQRCGPKRMPVVQVTERRRPLAARGQEHLAKAVALADAMPRDATRSEELEDAIGSARLLVLEPQFEAFARFELPKGMRFDVQRDGKAAKSSRSAKDRAVAVQRRSASQRALDAAIEKRRVAGNELAAAYQRIARTSADRWVLAALARIGDLHETTAYELWRAPVPRSIRAAEPRYFAYCDTLSDAAEPSFALASEGYIECLDQAVAWEAVEGPALRCEHRLQRSHVDRYPATHEFFGQPKYERTKMVSFGVQLEVEPQRPVIVVHPAPHLYRPQAVVPATGDTQ